MDAVNKYIREYTFQDYADAQDRLQLLRDTWGSNYYFTDLKVTANGYQTLHYEIVF